MSARTVCYLSETKLTSSFQGPNHTLRSSLHTHEQFVWMFICFLVSGLYGDLDGCTLAKVIPVCSGPRQAQTLLKDLLKSRQHGLDYTRWVKEGHFFRPCLTVGQEYYWCKRMWLLRCAIHHVVFKSSGKVLWVDALAGSWSSADIWPSGVLKQPLRCPWSCTREAYTSINRTTPVRMCIECSSVSPCTWMSVSGWVACLNSTRPSAIGEVTPCVMVWEGGSPKPKISQSLELPVKTSVSFCALFHFGFMCLSCDCLLVQWWKVKPLRMTVFVWENKQTRILNLSLYFILFFSVRVINFICFSHSLLVVLFSSLVDTSAFFSLCLLCNQVFGLRSN